MANTVRSACFLLALALLALAPLTSFSQTAPFNLPAQPLAESLKAVGAQTNINVMVSPSLVDGKQAPALKGNWSVKDALARLLQGTSLEYYFVNDQTVVIRDKTKAAASLEDPPVTQNLTHTGARDDAKETGTKSSQDLRVAQVGQANVGPQTVDQSSEKKKAEDLEEIVVTGTHIRGVSPTSPVIIIDSEEINRSGYTTIGDVLRSLPQNSSSGQSPQMGPSNSPSGTYAGNTFGSAPNLRGIGNTSTLTLVDGYRLPLDSQFGAIDTTLIPLAAVDRIEVVTDGASAVYGSDAVAGVVNIILKKNYDGAETTASVGTATDGGAFDWRASELLGKNWEGGGGVFVFEHEKQDPVDASQRSFTASAAIPTTLLPPTLRNSFYLSGEQSVAYGLSAFAEGLYTSRNSEGLYSYTDPQQTYDYKIPDIQSYLATGGLNANLPGGWKAKAFASVGGQNSSDYEFESGFGSTPQYTELLRGKTQTLEINADGTIAHIPMGDLRAALGAGDRLESYADLLPPGPAAVDAQRRVKYGFAEFSIPLAPTAPHVGLERLDLDISARYEDYSDFGSRTLPKFGILYVPIDSLKLRVSTGKSFRAPTFENLYLPGAVRYFNGTEFGNETPGSAVLAVTGGNPAVQPETATSDTVSLEFTPKWLDGFRATTTYFHIDYRNRIGAIPDELSALVDPAEAPFVTLNPSTALQQSLIANSALGFENYAGRPYVPGDVVAIIDNRPVNYGNERIQGADVELNYTLDTSRGEVKTFVNGTYIELRQQLTAESPTVELAGTSYNPPHFRARGGATWTFAGFSATAYANYISREVDTYQPGLPGVSSWTTFDAQVAYVVSKLGRVSGARISLSVQNLFDRAPPYIPTLYTAGLDYDSVNASPLGRFVTLQASIPVSW